jgi:hypothetical protein
MGWQPALPTQPRCQTIPETCPSGEEPPEANPGDKNNQTKNKPTNQTPPAGSAPIRHRERARFRRLCDLLRPIGRRAGTAPACSSGAP